VNDERHRFSHLVTRAFNRPLLIHPAKAEVIIGAIGPRMGVTSIVRVEGDLIMPSGPLLFDQEDENESRTLAGGNYETRGYDVQAGVAVIEVEGTLVQKLGSMRPYSGMTGYDGIRKAFRAAMADDGVRAICLLIDSPGGEAAGCFDLVDEIALARGAKPIWAILEETADSGAYAIASAADFITVPRTGETGSIGVILALYDVSRAMDKAGVRVSFITRGERKADGHPEIALSDEARARFQKDVDTMGVLFEETVARNRGLSADAIRDMNASTFLGEEGVTLGLADAVMAPDAAFQALLDELG
jgi:signal peptide peptidase SppA